MDNQEFEKVKSRNKSKEQSVETNDDQATETTSAEMKNQEFQKVKSRKRKSKGQSMETADDQGGEVAAKRPIFPPIAAEALQDSVDGFRKIPVPTNRYTPLKENWEKIYTPIVEHLKLQVRFNLQTRNVEIKTCEETKDIGVIQKAADFIRAFLLGFDVADALALVRLDDLFLETFKVTDVKELKGDHLSRAIGRVAGSHGKTKFTIENVCKVRIVLADSQINILGSYQNIRSARHSICSLIMGSPPSKVYGNMRAYASRSTSRF